MPSVDSTAYVKFAVEGTSVVVQNVGTNDVFISRNATDPVADGIKVTTAAGPFLIQDIHGGWLFAKCASGQTADLRVLQI